MLPLLCLLPAVLRRLKPAATSAYLLPTTYCLLLTACCLLLFLATPVSSETMGWAATYGGANHDEVRSIQQTSDGGFIATGWTLSFGAVERDVWVLKLRADGAIEWQKTYGGDNLSEANSIYETSDGGYIVAGWTNSFGVKHGSILVLKLGPDGGVEWQKTYVGVKFDRAFSIQQTRDGGYVMAGETKSSGAGDMDLLVLKLGPDGTVKWQKTYGGGDWDRAKSIQETSNGGYIVAGDTRSFGTGGEGFPDLWVLKLRPDGTIDWQKAYGGDNWDGANSIHETHDGGYIVAGETRSYGETWGDLWVLKLGPDGTVEWQKTHGGDRYDVANSIHETSDGGYIVAGDTGSFGAGGGDFWVLKLRANGAIEWQKAYGGASSDRAQSIQETRDGGYIVAGVTRSFGAGKEDFWILRLRPDGSFGYAQDKPIIPSCSFIRDTSVSGKDSNATVRPTSASVRDSNADPRNSSATVRDTNASATILCPP